MMLPALALRNVVRRPARSWLTVAVLGVCVSAWAFRHSVTEALAVLTRSMVMDSRTGPVLVHPREAVDAVVLGSPPRVDPAWVPLARAVPGVDVVTERLLISAQLSSGTSQTPVGVRGVNPGTEMQVCPRAHREVREGGRWLVDSDSDAVVLGYALADSLKLQVGDTVTLQGQSAEGRANALALRVVGISESGFALENRRVVTVPLSVARALVGLTDGASELGIGVPLDKVSTVLPALSAALGEGARARHWTDLQPLVRDMKARQERIDVILACVMLVVMASALLSLGLLSVEERTREIGTMLSFGMRRRSVAGLFVWEGIALGVFGAGVGLAFGALALTFAERNGLPLRNMGAGYKVLLRPSLSIFTIVVASLGCVALSALASGLIAWRASRVRPIIALNDGG